MGNEIKIYNIWQPEFVNFIPMDLYYPMCAASHYARAEGRGQFFFTDGKQVLPVEYIVDYKTKEKMPIIMLDGIVPGVERFFLQDEEFVNKCGFDIVENRNDCVIKCDKGLFIDHIKSLSQYDRQYKKMNNSGLFHTAIHSRFIPGAFMHTWGYSVNYWEERIPEEKKPGVNVDFVLGTLMSDRIKTVTISAMDNMLFNIYVMATFYVDSDAKELYWLYTHRNHKEELVNKYSLGNTVLVKGLEIAYELGYDFNLGLDFFDYKERWHGINKPIKGIKEKS